RDRTALKNREKNLTVALLKRQCRQRLEQIASHLKALEAEIDALIKADEAIARKQTILASIAGLGTVTANLLLAAIPDRGTMESNQSAARGSLARMTRQSWQRRGKSYSRGGRATVRRVLYVPGLVAARVSPDLTEKYDRLTDAGNPSNVAIAAVMRKLI